MKRSMSKRYFLICCLNNPLLFSLRLSKAVISTRVAVAIFLISIIYLKVLAERGSEMVKQECEELRTSLQNTEKELDDVRVDLSASKKKIVNLERDSASKEVSADRDVDVLKLQEEVTELRAEVELANKKAEQQEVTSEKYAKDIEQKVKQLDKIREEKDGLVEENSKLRQEVILNYFFYCRKESAQNNKNCWIIPLENRF